VPTRWIALGIAAAADALQLAVIPLFGEGFASPVNDALDLAVAGARSGSGERARSGPRPGTNLDGERPLHHRSGQDQMVDSSSGNRHARPRRVCSLPDRAMITF
jgi:hypothetical protein